MKKRIPNYENYIIYDTGELLNETTGKMLNGSIRLNGYKQYRLSKNNEKISFYAHRLVAEAFLPNPYNLPIVNHKDVRSGFRPASPSKPRTRRFRTPESGSASANCSACQFPLP